MDLFGDIRKKNLAAAAPLAVRMRPRTLEEFVGQQHILLPDVENGLILLVGATTENPFFAVNSPLVSRSQIFQFSPISEEDIRTLIRRAMTDKERGYGN